jgi:hypothetical protein
VVVRARYLCFQLPLAFLTLPGLGQAPPHKPPVLTTFALDNGAATVKAGAALVLAHTVAGAVPTEYRISARGDFEGSTWMAYDTRLTTDSRQWRTTPGCESPGSSRLLLFLQVRRHAGEEVRIVAGKRTLVPVWLESNVLADSICIGAGP